MSIMVMVMMHCILGAAMHAVAMCHFRRGHILITTV